MAVINHYIKCLQKGFIALLPFCMVACGSADTAKEFNYDSAVSCESNLPNSFSSSNSNQQIKTAGSSAEGMKWIQGGDFLLGASDNEGRPDEYPQRRVKLDGFWMDETEVTNAQFEKFVDATGYIQQPKKL